MDRKGPWDTPSLLPPKPRRRDLRLAIVLASVLAVGGLIMLLYRLFPDHVASEDEGGFLLRSVSIVAILAAGAGRLRGLHLAGAVRNALLWLGIVGVLVVGVSLKAEISGAAAKIFSSMDPAHPVEVAHHELVLTREADGSFYASGRVNGKPVQFLVDTGASDLALSSADAARIGLDPGSMRYSRSYLTANGRIFGAPFMAEEVEIGPIHLRNVAASVSNSSMKGSLLGMSFLSRLRMVRVEGDRLYLGW